MVINNTRILEILKARLLKYNTYFEIFKGYLKIHQAFFSKTDIQYYFT